MTAVSDNKLRGGKHDANCPAIIPDKRKGDPGSRGDRFQALEKTNGINTLTHSEIR